MRVNTIDTRHGSLNKREFSNGNTLPYTGVPFGMNYFVLQNQLGSNWFFDPTLPICQGIRLTHQPSPWMGDYSSLLMLPVTGEPSTANIEANQSSYPSAMADFHPHLMKIDLLRYRLTTELVPTMRGTKIRLTNQSKQAMGLLLNSEGLADAVLNETDKRLTLRIDHKVNEGRSNLNLYVVFDFNQSDRVTFNSEKKFVSFDTSLKQLELSVGTSFISEEQAVLNLEREVLHQSFDELKESASSQWEDKLSLIEVEDRDNEKVRSFNQYLYRLFLFPQTFYELDQKNQPIHYDCYSESTKTGKFFTNNGFWDTYRTVFPLFSLIIPEIYQEILEGFQHFYEESGHLPKWLSPDERGLMPGTLINAVIADAAVKGLMSPAQMKFFLDAMVKEATTPPTESHFGRAGVANMLQYGYVLNREIESVNQTLDNAYSDFCISRVAHLLNERELEEAYTKASFNYQHLFDPETGFMRGKDKAGVFSPGFIAEDWHYDYTEGSAWQNSLATFHNFQDYINLTGGPAKFVDHLITLANEEPIFEIGNYGMEIHEMTEYAVSGFGQIAVSNQSSFHLPYLFTYAGQPAYTQLLIKQLSEHSFSDGFEGFPGDEDNGSLSAWYVFNQLGFYPVTPGTTQYVLGIPQFDQSTLHLSNGKTFVIQAKNRLPQNNFVQENKLNDEMYSKLYLDFNDIVKGGRFDVKLSLLPPNKTYSVDELPFSLSNRQNESAEKKGARP